MRKRCCPVMIISKRERERAASKQKAGNGNPSVVGKQRDLGKLAFFCPSSKFHWSSSGMFLSLFIVPPHLSSSTLHERESCCWERSRASNQGQWTDHHLLAFSFSRTKYALPYLGSTFHLPGCRSSSIVRKVRNVLESSGSMTQNSWSGEAALGTISLGL